MRCHITTKGTEVQLESQSSAPREENEAQSSTETLRAFPTLSHLCLGDAGSPPRCPWAGDASEGETRA